MKIDEGNNRRWTRVLRAGLVAASAALAACTPEIRSLDIYTLEEGVRYPPSQDSAATVRVVVEPHYSRMLTPQLSLGEDNTFLPGRDMQFVDSPGSGLKAYEGTIALNPDYTLHRYYGRTLQARVEVPYRGNGNQVSRERRQQDFFVAAPLACFSFDGERGDEGWSARGYFRGEADVREAGFPIAQLRWDAGQNWPQLFDATNSGSLLFAIDGEGLAGQSWGGRLRDRYWSVELVSAQLPETGPRTVWKDLGVMQAKIRTEAEGLRVQAMLEYQTPSRQGRQGEIRRWRATVNGHPGGTPVFLEVQPGEWQALRFDFPSLPPGSKLLRVILRLFGEPSELAASDGKPVHIDYVCPVVR